MVRGGRSVVKQWRESVGQRLVVAVVNWAMFKAVGVWGRSGGAEIGLVQQIWSEWRAENLLRSQ